jgi:hypothetical protein
MKPRTLAIPALLLLLTWGAAGGDPPPSGGDFTLRRSSIDAGGGEGSGANFSLKGTIGQHDTEVMTGADFALRSGFWIAGEQADQLFRDRFESGQNPNE